jgi:phosphoglycolate phosphatase-like HAD superfamily hydrolase
MEKRYMVVINDVDGTLVDSFPTGFECCRTVARENGWPMNDAVTEIIFANWGSPTRLIVEKCWPGADYRPLQKALNDASRLSPPPPLFPGAYETVRFLKRRVVQHVFTGQYRVSAMPILVRHGILDCFGRVITKSDVKKTKPDPEGLEKLIVPYEKILGYDRDAFLLVGDNVYADGESAKAAGIDFLAVAESINVSRGFFLARGIPDSMIIDRYSDLPGFLGFS